MDTKTGKLEFLNQDDFNRLSGELIPIDMGLATEKQKLEMQISKHDNNSELGRIFTGSRRERREQERNYKKSLKKNK